MKKIAIVVVLMSGFIWLYEESVRLIPMLHWTGLEWLLSTVFFSGFLLAIFGKKIAQRVIGIALMYTMFLYTLTGV